MVYPIVENNGPNRDMYNAAHSMAIIPCVKGKTRSTIQGGFSFRGYSLTISCKYFAPRDFLISLCTVVLFVGLFLNEPQQIQFQPQVYIYIVYTLLLYFILSEFPNYSVTSGTQNNGNDIFN